MAGGDGATVGTGAEGGADDEGIGGRPGVAAGPRAAWHLSPASSLFRAQQAAGGGASWAWEGKGAVAEGAGSKGAPPGDGVGEGGHAGRFLEERGEDAEPTGADPGPAKGSSPHSPVAFAAHHSPPVHAHAHHSQRPAHHHPRRSHSLQAGAEAGSEAAGADDGAACSGFTPAWPAVGPARAHSSSRAPHASPALAEVVVARSEVEDEEAGGRGSGGAVLRASSPTPQPAIIARGMMHLRPPSPARGEGSRPGHASAWASDQEAEAEADVDVDAALSQMGRAGGALAGTARGGAGASDSAGRVAAAGTGPVAAPESSAAPQTAVVVKSSSVQEGQAALSSPLKEAARSAMGGVAPTPLSRALSATDLAAQAVPRPAAGLTPAPTAPGEPSRERGPRTVQAAASAASSRLPGEGGASGAGSLSGAPDGDDSDAGAGAAASRGDWHAPGGREGSRMATLEVREPVNGHAACERRDAAFGCLSSLRCGCHKEDPVRFLACSPARTRTATWSCHPGALPDPRPPLLRSRACPWATQPTTRMCSRGQTHPCHNITPQVRRHSTRSKPA